MSSISAEDGPLASKIATLKEAIAEHVAPGMHLCFASTPSRSNAAIRELARTFVASRPQLVLSTIGFHSMAHLLPLLGLGRKYVSCFFGDNYPIPRPNGLYTRVFGSGAALELWSLWSYVSALRAGALGDSWAITRSLKGTTMGEDLARAGHFVEVRPPEGSGELLGLVRAMRPDITFVHAPMGDARGNLVFAPPYAESFWSALGARRGVIATVERVVDPDVTRRFPEALRIPPHRVIAVCHEPFGAHPQPLFVPGRFGFSGYRDDFDEYVRWRDMAQDAGAFAQFLQRVVKTDDGGAAYREWVGEDRLSSLSAERPARPPRRGSSSRGLSESGQTPRLRGASDAGGAQRNTEQLLVLAARKIAARVAAGGFETILSGVGHGFLAARLAKLALADRQRDVTVMVETGLYDVACGPDGHDFLLSYGNIERAGRLSSVEDVLGAIACGADSSCLGVLGAAQVDAIGDINSTRLKTGKMLLGSGAANDVASAAAEVVVLTRCSRTRLVRKVDYITSPGSRVSTVVTERCTFTRPPGGRVWLIGDVCPPVDGRPLASVLAEIREECPWTCEVPPDIEYAPPLSVLERSWLHQLDIEGAHWRREVEGQPPASA